MVIAVACAGIGVGLGAHHPLWPLAVPSVLCLWILVALWRRDSWLLVMPAALPFLNLAPWTGWMACDEFDLLVLGSLAAGHARLAWGYGAAGLDPLPDHVRRPWLSVLLVALGFWTLAGLGRGLLDAGSIRLDLFEGYAGPANSVRIGKSLLMALLMMPMLREVLHRSPGPAMRSFCTAMVAGVLGVVLIGLWERLAFPGFWDFSTRYRVTAMFWEMHVGGAAIDGYLAMAMPFIGWALWSVRRPWQWALIAMLALAAAYVCLTTYARGVYLAVICGLVVSGTLLRMQQTGFDPALLLRRFKNQGQPVRWRSRARIALAAALVLEVLLVLGTGSFLAERMAASDRDFGSRMSHWARGVRLLHGPVDWMVGLGLGRLPAHYAASGPRGEFSGAAELGSNADAGGATEQFATVWGPPRRASLAGLYALTQRVDLVRGARYVVAMDLRTHAMTDVLVQVCERHLLYEGDCQFEVVRVAPDKGHGEHVEFELQGDPLTGGPLPWSRPVMFSIAVDRAGGVVDIHSVRLSAGSERNLLSNGDFSQGMAHWFAAAQFYFLPWHIDNLYLEWLIERGVVGLCLFGLLIAWSLWHLVFGPARKLPIAPYLAAALCSGLTVGLVSSMMDAPRVALLLLLLCLASLCLRHAPDQELPKAGSLAAARPKTA